MKILLKSACIYQKNSYLCKAIKQHNLTNKDMTKVNDTNNFKNRTAATIKSILKSNDIPFEMVTNDGDSNQFGILTPNTIKTKMMLKQAGFIRLDKWSTKNVIVIKCH